MKNDCPCYSGESYANCCKPLHEGRRIADTPEQLMRSRYAAFARGIGKYLIDTLAADHPDRKEDQQAFVIALSRAKDTQRFLGLEIKSAMMEGDHGEVTFHARIFERGVDKSFTERSSFVRENGAWRYANGDVGG